MDTQRIFTELVGRVQTLEAQMQRIIAHDNANSQRPHVLQPSFPHREELDALHARVAKLEASLSPRETKRRRK